MSDWQEQIRLADEAARAEMLALPAVAVRHHAVLDAAEPGDVLVSASVGPAGEAVAVWVSARDVPAVTAVTTSPGGSAFPRPLADRTVPARVTTHSPGVVRLVDIVGLPLAHVTAQPLPGGRVLVVGVRSEWRQGGADRNAIVYDASGQIVAREVLGDGIEHVFAASTGEVWVGYFDEGVFGNYGWGEPFGRPPVGSCGLARFTASLQPAWRFPGEAGSPVEPISDCYALNVTDDATWACYYAGFPVVRISGDRVSSWFNEITGAKAMAVSGPRVALCGGYQPMRDRLVVGELSGDRLQITGRYRVTLPGGQHLPENTKVIGRGPVLHFLAGGNWFQLDITCSL